MLYAEMDSDMMQIMVQDFVADGAGEYDDLTIHYNSARYDAEMDSWVIDAEDETHDYLLVADDDGNISIHTIGTK